MENTIIGLTGVIIVAASGIVTALINKGFLTPTTSGVATSALLARRVDMLGHYYGCQRLTIILYHNGGHGYDGKSLEKFTVIHEYYNAAQTSPTHTMLQGVSTGMLKELPSLLEHNKIVFEADINLTEKKLINRPSYFKTMREYGTTATVAAAINKKVFNWKKFKYETKMIASIHFNWGENSKGWSNSFLTSEKDSLPLANDIKLLMTAYDPAHIHYDVWEHLKTQIDKCKETL
jgi:hypothetical protein